MMLLMRGERINKDREGPSTTSYTFSYRGNVIVRRTEIRLQQKLRAIERTRHHDYNRSMEYNVQVQIRAVADNECELAMMVKTIKRKSKCEMGRRRENEWTMAGGGCGCTNERFKQRRKTGDSLLESDLITV